MKPLNPLPFIVNLFVLAAPVLIANQVLFVPGIPTLNDGVVAVLAPNPIVGAALPLTKIPS